MDAVVALQDEYRWSAREISRRTGRNASDLSVMLRVARDPELAVLVYDDIVSPTTAGMMFRLSRQNRARAMARAQTRGLRVRHVEQMLAEEDRIRRDVTDVSTPHELAHAIIKTMEGDGQNEADMGERGRVISHTMQNKVDAVIGDQDADGRVISHAPRDGTNGDSVLSDGERPAVAYPRGDTAGAMLELAEELVHVVEHTRRKHTGPEVAGALPLRSTAEVERLARDIITFAHDGGRLDAGQRAMLREAWAHMTPLLNDEDA